MPEIEVRVGSPAISGHRVRLAATVAPPDDEPYELWFELDAREQDAVVERADPFVLATLFLAMRAGCDLRVRGAPVAPSLLRNLAEFLEAWRVWRNYPAVGIEAEQEAEGGAHGRPAVAAFSGGVDAAFTVYQHATGRCGRRRRDLRAGAMMHGYDVPRDDPVGFAGAATRARRMLDDLNLDLLIVETNVFQRIAPPTTDSLGMALAAMLTLLGGRFDTGLVASSGPYEPLIVPLGSNPVTDWMLGSASFEIVHDGAATNRLEKVRALADWDEAVRSLRFCYEGARRDRNCGRCRKCVYTALMFRVVGVDAHCFDEPLDERAILEVIRRSPHDAFSRNYATLVRDEATRLGMDDEWVRVLRRRLRYDHYRAAAHDTFPRFSRALARTRAGPRGAWSRIG